MDTRLLSDVYSTPWFVALVDELVQNLHQNHPNANWTHLPPLTSEVSVAKPQVLYVRAPTCTSSSSAQGNSGNNGNTNGNGNSNSNGNGSTNNSSTSSGNNTVLIAAVGGAVGGCLLLAGIIFFLYRRRVKRKHAVPPPPPPALTPNATLLDSTPMAGGKTQPMQFQGGPVALTTTPSTYVPSSSGDSSSQYNYAMPLSPQWTGPPSTHLGHLPPSSQHPSTYYTSSSGHQTAPPSSIPPPWAVPMHANSQPQPQAYMPQPNVAPGPSPSPGMEKAQFSGYPTPSHQAAIPAWAVDHKNSQLLSVQTNSAGPSGSGTGAPLSNVLEQPGDALPPPAYSATPSSL